MLLAPLNRSSPVFACPFSNLLAFVVPLFLLLLPLFCSASLPDNSSFTNTVNSSPIAPLPPKMPIHHGVKVASLKFDYVKAELVLALFILVIGLFKLSYHQYKYPQALVPESCCLIILGTLLGLIFWWTGTFEELKFLEFDQKVFFFLLLPPIILEAAYSLNDRAFVDNLGTICLYAVVGTIMNIAIVGGLLIWAEWAGIFGTFGIHVLDSLLFSSLIAAVDPVAVLAIFKEVGVNQMLYFMVFGESLLNDAVTVVCYNLINDFKQLDDVTLFDCFLGFVAFLCVSFGGLLIGTFFGVLSALITKFTSNVRVVEPVICFTIAYLSYVCSELFHFSGIIGIIACGLIQIQYTMQNLSAKSQISINYIIKVVSSVSESLIFIILGVMLVNEQNWFWTDWHPLFSLFSLLFCVFSRFFVVFLLTYIVNCFTGGVRYISFQEQIIMAYGGLRGAVSFSLAFMLSDEVETKSTLLSATYIVILCTVFGQGCTIKSVVKCLNIRLAKKDDNFRLFNAFNKGMVNHMTHGIEEIIGIKEHTAMKLLGDFSKDYVRPALQRDYIVRRTEDKLVMIENEENFKDTLRMNKTNTSLIDLKSLEDITEQGSATVEIIDQQREKQWEDGRTTDNRRRRLQQTEHEVEQLTKGTMQIQALFHGHGTMAYPDRNLVDEAKKEIFKLGAANAYDKHMDRIARISEFREMEKPRRWGRLIGGQKQKVSVNNGMLATSAPTLCLSSTAMHQQQTKLIESLQEIAESEENEQTTQLK